MILIIATTVTLSYLCLYKDWGEIKKRFYVHLCDVVKPVTSFTG